MYEQKISFYSPCFSLLSDDCSCTDPCVKYINIFNIKSMWTALLNTWLNFIMPCILWKLCVFITISLKFYYLFLNNLQHCKLYILLQFSLINYYYYYTLWFEFIWLLQLMNIFILLWLFWFIVVELTDVKFNIIIIIIIL